MQLTAVSDLLTSPGPFVTVHADVGRPAEDGRQQAEARWTTIRHRLEHLEVDADVVAELGRRLLEVPDLPGEARRTIVATSDGVLFDRTLPGSAGGAEHVEVAPLPDLAAWVAATDAQVPLALAVCDKEGADVSFPADAHLPATSESVGGATLHEHQVGAAVAEPQYQRHSERTWRLNAEDVAAAVVSGVREHHLRLVVLAGDPTARRLVREGLEQLEAQGVDVVEVDAGGRAAGASEEALVRDVEVAAAQHEARREADLLETLGSGEGQAGTSARGLDAVLDAFVKGAVDRLVVDLDALREEAVDTSAVPGLPVPAGLGDETPADRVLLAAAAATSAEVVTLPAAQNGGVPVAAVLRWSEAPTPADTV